MAALSMEYRVGIDGPASAAGFFDLGWTRLSPRQAGAAGTGARLIEETSGVLRASLGGELRLDLPVLRQPARLIFSWNPLRLDRLVEGAAAFRLDPRHSVRFALGSVF
jgi:hypothetical protein